MKTVITFISCLATLFVVAGLFNGPSATFYLGLIWMLVMIGFYIGKGYRAD